MIKNVTPLALSEGSDATWPVLIPYEGYVQEKSPIEINTDQIVSSEKMDFTYISKIESSVTGEERVLLFLKKDIFEYELKYTTVELYKTKLSNGDKLYTYERVIND